MAEPEDNRCFYLQVACITHISLAKASGMVKPDIKMVGKYNPPLRREISGTIIKSVSTHMLYM